MDSLIHKIRHHIVTMKTEVQYKKLLVACSGGIDSVALVHLIDELKQQLNYQYGIVHVDHMLRGQQSYEDLQFVQQLSVNYGVPFYSERIDIPKLVVQHRDNVQQRCRIERYDFFYRVMEREGYDLLLTAHHLDDHIETAMMQMLRGQKPIGILAERPFRTKQLLRPLLQVTKKELLTYLQDYQYTYRHDPSNDEDDYVRNAIRQHVLPEIEKIEPNYSKLVARSLHGNQLDEQALNDLAKESLKRVQIESSKSRQIIDCNAFQKEASALQSRVILILLNYLYSNQNEEITYSKRLLNRIQAELNREAGEQIVHLPNGYQVRRSYNRAYFEKRERLKRGTELSLPLNTIVQWGSYTFQLCFQKDIQSFEKSKQYYSLSESELKIRTRREGDRLHWEGMERPKKLARLFIDEKIAKQERDTWPIIVNGRDEVLVVPYLRCRYDVRLNESDKQTYMLVVERN